MMTTPFSGNFLTVAFRLLFPARNTT